MRTFLAQEPSINSKSQQFNWPSGSGVEESSPHDEPHVSGDSGLRFLHLRVGAGVLHPADGLLEGVFPWWHGHHHSYLLVQPVENLRHGLNRSLQLQRLPLDAGAGWSASFLCLPHPFLVPPRGNFVNRVKFIFLLVFQLNSSFWCLSKLVFSPAFLISYNCWFILVLNLILFLFLFFYFFYFKFSLFTFILIPRNANRNPETWCSSSRNQHICQCLASHPRTWKL